MCTFVSPQKMLSQTFMTGISCCNCTFGWSKSHHKLQSWKIKKMWHLCGKKWLQI